MSRSASTRFTCEILRPIPVGEITVTARRARPGLSVELLEATMSAHGHDAARATAWRVQRTEAVPTASRHREPVGEWICLDAQTTLSHGGTGIATSVLSDLDGLIGVGAQALLIAQRPVRVPQPA